MKLDTKYMLEQYKFARTYCNPAKLQMQYNALVKK